MVPRSLLPFAGVLAAACVILAASGGVGVHAARHHTHTPHGAHASASLSQIHPLSQVGNTHDPSLLEMPKAIPTPNADALRGTRPNLVYIMADDSGYGDLGANGFGADTPFLDQLAAGGIRFTDFHSGSSICTPSRANVMTGRLGLRTGVTDLFWPESLHGLPRNETTLAEMLVAAKYHTAIVGKWHLGHVDGHHPSYRGFEETFGLPWGPGDGCVDVPDFDLVPKPRCPKDPLLDGAPAATRMFSLEYAQRDYARTHGRSLSAISLGYDGKAPANLLYDVPGPNCQTEGGAVNGAEELQQGPDESVMEFEARAKEYQEGRMPPPEVTKQCNQWILEQPVNLTSLTDKYVAKSDSLIRRWAKEQQSAKASGAEGKPFFLYVPLSHTHAPLFFDPRWTGSSKSKSIYGDTLREMDYQVQALYDSLKSAGVLDNTLIIYSSDNGPWEVMCQYGGSSGPFLGEWQKSATGGGGGATSKLTTWEAGHRVPSIAHWEGRIKPGQVSAALGSHLDIVPTFLALAGVPLPSDRQFDGVDLSPVLFDGAASVRDHLFHAEYINGNLTAMRFQQYKAYFKTYSVPSCNGTGPTPQHEIIHNPPLVFDLSQDPAEAKPLTNVAPALLQKFDQLRLQKLADIYSTPHTWANMTLGTTSAWPCCNPNHVDCRCED